ncbi:MAG: hypothetical protein CR997_01725 [Acidobacteria bacterium]|nr:MAG: hypothetical protein CR997_01725 [Acidobacteriota bacterium]
MNTDRWLIYLFVVLGLLWNCSKESDQQFLNHIQKVMNKIKAAEEQLAQNDPGASGDLKRWRQALKEAERLSLEGNEVEAQEQLGQVENEVVELVGNRKENMQFAYVTGTVTQGGKPVKQGEPVLEENTVEVKTNSLTELKLYNDSMLTLLPNSTLKIIQIRPWGRSFICELVKGAVVYEQKGKMTKFYLKAGSREFDQASENEFEVCLRKTDEGYVIPNKTDVNLVFEGQREKVRFGEGFIWSGDMTEHVQPLPAPEIILPSMEQTILAVRNERVKEVTFEWEKIEDAAYYLMDIFTDAGLKKPWKTSHKVTQNTEKIKVPAGVFYWRVKAVSKDHFPGYSSKVSWFSFVNEELEKQNQKDGPELKNVQIELLNDMAIVSGQVDDSVSVSVNHTKAVRTMDGGFKVVLSLQFGEQQITIVATDNEGAQTIKRYTVNSDF